MLRFGALVLLNQSSFKPAEGSSLQSLAISLPSFRPLELNCALSSLPRLSSWAICSPSMSKEALRESVQVHEGVRAKRQRSDCIICRVHRLSPCPFDQKMSLPPVAPSTSPDPNPKSCSVPRVGARKYVTFLLVFPRWRKQIRRDGGKERANVFFFWCGWCRQFVPSSPQFDCLPAPYTSAAPPRASYLPDTIAV